MECTQEELMQVFNKFDLDKDGKISFTDFKESIGYVLHPKCDEYFRQDCKEKLQSQACHFKGCSFLKVGLKNLCKFHL